MTVLLCCVVDLFIFVSVFNYNLNKIIDICDHVNFIFYLKCNNI